MRFRIRFGLCCSALRSPVRGAVVVVACSALLLSGCGSSGSSKAATAATTPFTTQDVTTTGPSPMGVLGRRVGKVTVIGTDTITIVTKLIGAVQLRTPSATKYERAVTGNRANITVGLRVLITLRGADVLVLPQDSRVGRLVTNVASGSFSIARLTLKRVQTILFSNVKEVETIASAKRSDLKPGSEVFAAGRQAGRSKFNPVEVILLPAGSPFGN